MLAKSINFHCIDVSLRKYIVAGEENTRFFTSNTFIRNARLKLAKNQANAKQHHEAELVLFENYSHPS